MVGNDIVDIAEAEKASNWQRPRFLGKLFSYSEQQLIQNDDNPTLMVWRLWSMKEAAYKLFTQAHPSRFYNPKSFQCEVKGHTGEVRYHSFQCYVQTKITTEYIISEARLQPGVFSSKVVVFESKNQKEQSRLLKQELLNHIRISTKKISELQLVYNEFGIPVVKINTELKNISLTHHGRFGGFALSDGICDSMPIKSLHWA